MALSDFLISSKMSEARRDINKASKQSGRALGKQGSWAGFGRMLGGLGAPLAAAAFLGGPIGWAGAALATGVGSFLGGAAGRRGAMASKGGRVSDESKATLKGGPSSWMKGSRETIREDVADMRQYLKESNLTESVKSGIVAGITTGGKELVQGLKGQMGASSLSGATGPNAALTSTGSPKTSIATGTAAPKISIPVPTQTAYAQGAQSFAENPAVKAASLTKVGGASGTWGTKALTQFTGDDIRKASSPVATMGRTAGVADPNLRKAGVFSKEKMWGTGLKSSDSPYRKLAAGVRGAGQEVGSGLRGAGEWAKGSLEDLWHGGRHVGGSTSMKTSGMKNWGTDLEFAAKDAFGNIRDTAGQLHGQATKALGRAEGNFMMGIEGAGTAAENLQLAGRGAAQRAVGGAQDLWYGGKATSTGAGQVGISGGISGIPTDIKYAAQGALSDLGEYGQRLGGQFQSGARGAASSMYEKWGDIMGGGRHQYQGMDIKRFNPYDTQ